MNILFYDTETTGKEYTNHYIHQLAGIFVMDGVEKFEFNYNLRPGLGKIDQMALEISGKTREEIYAYPFPNLALENLHKQLDQYVDYTQRSQRIILAGHGVIHFDNPFFKRLHQYCGDNTFDARFWQVSIDTMQMAGSIWREDLNAINSFSLGALCKSMGVEFDSSQNHDAMYDARKSMELYRKLVAVETYGLAMFKDSLTN